MSDLINIRSLLKVSKSIDSSRWPLPVQASQWAIDHCMIIGCILHHLMWCKSLYEPKMHHTKGKCSVISIKYWSLLQIVGMSFLYTTQPNFILWMYNYMEVKELCPCMLQYLGYFPNLAVHHTKGQHLATSIQCCTYIKLRGWVFTLNTPKFILCMYKHRGSRNFTLSMLRFIVNKTTKGADYTLHKLCPFPVHNKVSKGHLSITLHTF